MVVDITTDPEFEAGTPRVLFEGAYDAHLGATDYDISPDGRRFVMVRRSRESVPAQIHVILNWFDVLKRQAPSN
jgi:hypothetical protein